MNFASDNSVGASPRILQALLDANAGAAAAYGADPWSARAGALLAETFEADCAVWLVATGTAANALALATLVPPYGAAFCHADAHVSEDECGAPEMFTGGAKIVGLPGRDGKLTPAALAAGLARYPKGAVKSVQPAAISISQATECGTLYSRAEVAALAAAAKAAGLRVHMDGARFSNAIAAGAGTPAELTWKAGVDVLTLGATKDGALACEAIVVFDRALAPALDFARKRAGHTLSKGRLLGAQMCAWLEGGHWLELARRANAAAARLAAGLAAIPGVELAWPAQANEIFPVLPKAKVAALRAAGAVFYDWTAAAIPARIAEETGRQTIRLVTSFATEDAEIDRFLALAGAP
ncbi:MAG: low specificity L-threonine aldolase [Hyphomicrobiales bacterium]|nr:low specificity L-threonine aldolase [Hyphomicrobiales bacterium]